MANTNVRSEKIRCCACGELKNEKRDFYNSNSYVYRDKQLTPICKGCVVDLYNKYYKDFNGDERKAVYYVCERLDIYFENKLFNSALEQAKNNNSSVIVIYIQKVNSLKQYNGMVFLDSEKLNDESEEDTITDVPKEIVETTVIEEVSELLTEEYIDEENDKKNRDDVIRLLGYDPFEKENPNDKRYLYNTLIDYLDEATLEDSFKLPTVIEIVKSFNQVEKINQALTVLTSDIMQLSSNVAEINSLMGAKEKMIRAILALAKDNGISINNSNNKSKGSNTLSGIVKKLDEIGLESAELNLFNIETAQAMKQVADISHKSIIEQLMLNESDYTEMIAKQKDMLRDLNEKVMNLEEENRLLRIKIKRQEKNNISERG